MGHDWIFEVLSDVKAYADRHGLVALAAKAEEALAVARAEIAAEQGDDGETGTDRPGRPGARGEPSRRN